jgi:hypothetical protein
VLRWSWRVGYYAYNALGSDLYPPFTLSDEVDYPARLDVAYPTELSRRLVLVKWWLLALPQYLIVAILSTLVTLSPGIAGLTLLFTGRYPQGIHDLVIGMNRWTFRVAAYAALMTDAYPPFRLDAGSCEPATDAVSPVPAEALS